MHDSFITDCVPAGLTFQAYGAEPRSGADVRGTGTNGCAAGTTRLVWDAGRRRTRRDGHSHLHRPASRSDAVAGATYTNTATLTGSTLDDGQTDPLAPTTRTSAAYAVSASSTVTIAGASITKTVTPDPATIGQRVTWTVTATMPRQHRCSSTGR